MEMGIGRDADETSVHANHCELFFWPSNSTLESNTSTVGYFEDVSSINQSNLINDGQRKDSECNSVNIPEYYYEPSRNKVQRSISSILSNNNKRKNFDKCNSTGDILAKQNIVKEHSRSENAKKKLQKILGRRSSSSSGQWKGVRWKPVIDDAAGDRWSDNSNMKNTNRSSTPPPTNVFAQRKCISCTCSSLQKLELLKPVLPVNHTDALHYSEPNIDVVSEKKRESVIGSSLPNISVSFSSGPAASQESKTTDTRKLPSSISKNSLTDETMTGLRRQGSSSSASQELFVLAAQSQS